VAVVTPGEVALLGRGQRAQHLGLLALCGTARRTSTSTRLRRHSSGSLASSPRRAQRPGTREMVGLAASP
jgi:hypothetical protein